MNKPDKAKREHDKQKFKSETANMTPIEKDSLIEKQYDEIVQLKDSLDYYNKERVKYLSSRQTFSDDPSEN